MRVRLGPEAEGSRLDVALVAALEAQGVAISRSALAVAFAAGEVCDAEGRALKASRKVAGETEVELELPSPAPLAEAFPEDIPLAVVHEDADVLVVDKPAGMVVHAGPGHSSGTLVNAVLHHLGVDAAGLPTLPGNDATRPGIVHRIDRGTTGLLVVAKSPAAQAHLAGQFAAHDIEREYVGLVAGVPTWESQVVRTLHGRDARDRRKFSAEVQRGRKAVTHMHKLEGFARASQLRFRLETGRTHQIRVHARYLGHPILGDALYGGTPGELREWVEELPGHALHARVLGFEHPSGEKLRFEAPLPPEFEALAEALRAM